MKRNIIICGLITILSSHAFTQENVTREYLFEVSGGEVDDRYGVDAIEVIGDVNGDGIQDLIVTAKGSANDTGAIFIQTISNSGKTNSTQEIFRSQTALTNELVLSYEGVANGVAVLDKFDGSKGDCATYVASILASSRLLVHTVCEEGGRTKYKNHEFIESTNIQNLPNSLDPNSRYGRSIELVQETSNGWILAVGADRFMDVGGVVFLKMDRNYSVSYLGIITKGSLPNSTLSGLEKNDNFGSKIQHVGDLDNDGDVDLVAVAYGDDEGGNFFGSIYNLYLDYSNANSIKLDSITKISALTDTRFQQSFMNSFAFSFGAGDFNHDGNVDYVVATNRMEIDGNPYVGGANILFLDEYQNIVDVKHLKKGSLGFVDSNNVIGSGPYNLGYETLVADLNDDGMLNVLLGMRFANDEVGGIWNLEIKSAPWERDTNTVYEVDVDSIGSNESMLVVDLFDKYGGYDLSFDIAGNGDTSIAKCILVSGTKVYCDQGMLEGSLSLEIKITDGGNIDSHTNALDENIKYSLKDSIIIKVVEGYEGPVTSINEINPTENKYLDFDYSQGVLQNQSPHDLDIILVNLNGKLIYRSKIHSGEMKNLTQYLSHPVVVKFQFAGRIIHAFRPSSNL